MSDWRDDPEAAAEAEAGRARARSGSGGSGKGGGGGGGLAGAAEPAGVDGSAKRNIVRKGVKKQGGGHKGHWAATDDGTVMLAKGSLDRDDPNYDSAVRYLLLLLLFPSHPPTPPTQSFIPSTHPPTTPIKDDDPENTVLEEARYDGGPRVREEEVGMPLAAFKARIADALKEYFVSEDLEEMTRSVSELDAKVYHYELVKRAISMSLDGKERERELVSRLLSSLYPTLLSTADVGKGFERLFETVDDLQVDVPSAVRDIATFLARAVVDEILPPSFLSDPLVVGLGGEMVEHAKLLLSRDHMGARYVLPPTHPPFIHPQTLSSTSFKRPFFLLLTHPPTHPLTLPSLEHIWGPGDGRSVPEMKIAIDQLVQVSLSSPLSSLSLLPPTSQPIRLLILYTTYLPTHLPTFYRSISSPAN